MENLTIYNGNNQPVVKGLPVIIILTKHDYNDVALEHIAKNTGLHFVKGAWGNYSAQPQNSGQIVCLFLTYNFKTQYHDNATSKNTLYLKGDHHVGFKVDSICFECCGHNHVPTQGLDKQSRLAC